VGGGARKYRQSTACQANAKRQGTVYRQGAAKLGGKDSPFETQVSPVRTPIEYIPLANFVYICKKSPLMTNFECADDIFGRVK
jgi:hypothetical protein